MKTTCFDAAVNFPPSASLQTFDVTLVLKSRKVPASFSFYERPEAHKPEEFLVQVFPHRPLSLRWKDTFEVEKKKERGLLGGGVVVNPFSSKVIGKKIKKRVDFLSRLRGGKKEMLLALTQDKGIKGLREKEIINFSHLSRSSLRHLCQEMEKEGEIRILSFSPLFLISQKSLVFLQRKIVTYLEQFHSKHPGKRGVSQEIIRKRYGLYQKVLALALEHLIKQGRIEKSRGMIALSSFKITHTPEEEQVLRELEEMCLRGEFRTVSLEDIQRKFHLSPTKLQTMLSLLIEKKKIVQSKEGFFLHSHWLEEIIFKLRKYGSKELTVSDFKRITGLTRKYVIPLLELLDQMGVTRRIGPSRRKIL